MQFSPFYKSPGTLRGCLRGIKNGLGKRSLSRFRQVQGVGSAPTRSRAGTSGQRWIWAGVSAGGLATGLCLINKFSEGAELFSPTCCEGTDSPKPLSKDELIKEHNEFIDKALEENEEDANLIKKVTALQARCIAANNPSESVLILRKIRDYTGIGSLIVTITAVTGTPTFLLFTSGLAASMFALRLYQWYEQSFLDNYWKALLQPLTQKFAMRDFNTLPQDVQNYAKKAMKLVESNPQIAEDVGSVLPNTERAFRTGGYFPMANAFLFFFHVNVQKPFRLPRPAVVTCSVPLSQLGKDVDIEEMQEFHITLPTPTEQDEKQCDAFKTEIVVYRQSAQETRESVTLAAMLHVQRLAGAAGVVGHAFENVIGHCLETEKLLLE